jgi:hypothetical protein
MRSPVNKAVSRTKDVTKVMSEIVVADDLEVEVISTNGWGPVDLTFMTPTAAPAPPLPLDKLPPSFAELVGDFVEARRLVPDFAAFSILSACSGAIGNRARVRLYDGTLEPLAVFTALVGEASTGKSLAIGTVEPPLRLLDGDLLRGAIGVIRATGRAAVAQVDSKIRKKVAGRLAIAYETPEIQSTDEPANPILLSETTGPGLIEELGGDMAGRTLITHELVGALGYLGSSQPQRSRGLLLQGYDGNPVVVVSKTAGRIVIPALLLTILGATQPARLHSLLRNADDGFAARFFWIFPNSTPVVALGLSSGPLDLLTAILARLRAIQPARNSEAYSAVVPLAPEALVPLEAASGKWAIQQQLSGGLISATLGRGRQYAIRLAGLFEIIAHAMAEKPGLPPTVGLTSITSAIALVDEYILPMAERVFSAEHGKDSDAVAIAKYIARTGRTIINVRADIVRGRGSPVSKPLAVREAVEELVQRSVLKHPPQSSARGRPSSDLLVHPELLALARK